MAQKKDKKTGLISTNKTVGENRRARYDYALEDKFEAGIMLHGTEVKSLRHGQCSIAESYVGPDKHQELYLFNANIPEYSHAHGMLQHEPKRPRKFFLHKKELKKLTDGVQRNGYSIIPTRLYFNKRGLVKLEIALAKGKKLHDKRETEKKRDWNKQKHRLMREKN